MLFPGCYSMTDIDSTYNVKLGGIIIIIIIIIVAVDSAHKK
jgi:hypothetical protein